MRASVIMISLLLGAAVASGQFASDPTAISAPAVGYTLLEGSYFVDDCPVCGRPTILQPMRGTFDLVLLERAPPFTRYAVRNVDFTASPGWAGETRITGEGIYQRLEEFVVLQAMELATQVKDALTNRVAYFSSGNTVAQQPFPLIEISLTQTNGTHLQVFQMHLVAAPLRAVWFSINRSLQRVGSSSPTNRISPGDLLSMSGRVVKSNLELVGALGIMPVVPDLGLDALEITRRGEILFSITQNVFSELLGPLRHGDLLSNRGRIVKRNQELLAAFGVASSSPDAGLDAVQVMPDGEILFSIESNVVVTGAVKLGRGDILSDRGRVFRSNAQLLANFRPANTNRDYGLDALHVRPSGEIWFSIEEGFMDNRLGAILPGDLLSDRGRRVFSNRELVAAFKPADPAVDYGLDALFLVSDTKPPDPPPRIVKLLRNGASGSVRLEWDGEGEVFQLERAESLAGPWCPCSPILPDLSFDDACDLTGGLSRFYRLRQW